MVGKRLVNTGGAAGAAAFDPLQNFETVTYTGNGGTQKITGYIRKGAAFNGSSSYIDTSVSVLPADNYTVSMWVYHNSLKNSCALYTQYRGTVTGRHIVNSNANGGIQINTSSTNSLSSITATPFTTNTWQHLVVTKSSTSGYVVYIDGSSIGSWSNTDNIITDQSTQFGGDTEWSGDHWLNGKIDQVRIFDKALDQDDVDDLYLETYDSSTKSTTDIFGDGSGVALYELDEDANDTGVPIDSGQSASFIGTNQNYIQLPSGVDTILNTKNFGLSFWVKAPNATTDAAFSTETTNSTFQIHANWAHAGSYSLINGGGSNINLGAVDDLWHHIVVTSDGSSSYKGYFDKSYKGASAYRQTSNVGTFLGAHPAGGFNLLGEIDQVRIFNRQLSQSDIDALYNETAPTTVDYFGDGNGKALYTLNGTPDDESGSYDATWNGTAAYSDPALLTQYNGTPTNVNFLGMAFQPDLVWVKERTNTSGHHLGDSVRGATKMIYSNLTNAESTDTATITSFDTNGFTVGSSGGVNAGTDNYVAWCWKAGGAAVSNTEGTITSQVSANQDAGFSIVKYTGTFVAATVGHGLSSAPEMVIVKNTDSATNWWVWHTGLGDGTKYLKLNGSDAVNSVSSIWNSTVPTSTVFSVANDGGSNGNGNEIIAYCFHSVDGYQKVGSYTGNTANPPTVSLGFQPRWILIKKADSDTSFNHWNILDTIRDGDNQLNKVLFASLSSAEATFMSDYVDISTDGFTPNGGFNGNGINHIYLAIA